MEIHYSKQAVKFLSKQTAATRSRIINAVALLPAGDVKKLTGQPYYRLRVGDYRVLFFAFIALFCTDIVDCRL